MTHVRFVPDSFHFYVYIFHPLIGSGSTFCVAAWFLILNWNRISLTNYLDAVIDIVKIITHSPSLLPPLLFITAMYFYCRVPKSRQTTGQEIRRYCIHRKSTNLHNAAVALVESSSVCLNSWTIYTVKRLSEKYIIWGTSPLLDLQYSIVCTHLFKNLLFSSCAALHVGLLIVVHRYRKKL